MCISCDNGTKPFDANVIQKKQQYRNSICEKWLAMASRRNNGNEIWQKTNYIFIHWLAIEQRGPRHSCKRTLLKIMNQIIHYFLQLINISQNLCCKIKVYSTCYITQVNGLCQKLDNVKITTIIASLAKKSSLHLCRSTQRRISHNNKYHNSCKCIAKKAEK